MKGSCVTRQGPNTSLLISNGHSKEQVMSEWSGGTVCICAFACLSWMTPCAFQWHRPTECTNGSLGGCHHRTACTARVSHSNCGPAPRRHWASHIRHQAGTQRPKGLPCVLCDAHLWMYPCAPPKLPSLLSGGGKAIGSIRVQA
jgi:hypothetical protein